MAKKIGVFLSGALCLILGITLVLMWWPEVVRLYKGVIGMALALIGMILLYLARE